MERHGPSSDSKIIKLGGDTLNHLRVVRSNGDAHLLRLRGAEPMVHSCLCRGLRARLRLRLSARSLAVRIGRSGLVWSGDTPVGFSGTLEVIPCRLANHAGLAAILPAFWDRCCHR